MRNTTSLDELLWFPSSVSVTKNDNDDKTTGTNSGSIHRNLITFINEKHALDMGFQVTVGKVTNVKEGQHLVLKCRRWKKANCGTGSKQQTHTILSQEEDGGCCGWLIHVYYHSNNKHYFVKKHSPCVFTHSGHLPIDREHMQLGQSNIPDDIKKIAEELLGKNAPTKVVQLLLDVMGSDRISANAMSKMRSAVVVSSQNKGSTGSTADTLLKMLDEKEGAMYCYMTGYYNEALRKIRVRKVTKKKSGKSKKSKKKKSKIEMEKGFEHLEEEDCADHDTSVYVKNVVDALKLGSGEILLAVAFVSADGRKYHQMFPRVMGADVKYGTNNERRPLLRLVGRTGSNKIFS